MSSGTTLTEVSDSQWSDGASVRSWSFDHGTTPITAAGVSARFVGTFDGGVESFRFYVRPGYTLNIKVTLPAGVTTSMMAINSRSASNLTFSNNWRYYGSPYLYRTATGGAETYSVSQTTVDNTGIAPVDERTHVGIWWIEQVPSISAFSYTMDVEYVSMGTTTPTSPRGVRDRHDFDGDGKADILWFNNQTRQIAIWTMDGASRTGAGAIQNTIAAGWEVSGVGDFNGDARSDILFRHTSNGDLAIWTMNGLSRTAGAVVQDGGLPSSTRVAGVADLNGDGKADIILHDTNGDVTVWLMDGTTKSSSAVVQRGVNSAWSIAGTGDFNGDGKADLLWRRSDTGLVAIWTMDGTTRTAGATIQETVDRAWSVQTVGDLNGDGNADIVWRHTDGRVATWLMNGTTRVSGGVVGDGPLSTDWQIADAADFNADGKSDLLLRNTRTGGSAVWTMDGMSRTSGSIVQQSGDTSWQAATGFGDPLIR